MSDPLLEVEDLVVHFDTYEGRHEVLNGVDLRVDQGETVALVGETGCGKSVTAETVMGMLPQPPAEIVSGEVRYRGENLLADPDEHRRTRAEEMSMIFQDPMSHLSPAFTIGEMMADAAGYRDGDGYSWRRLLRTLFSRDRKRNTEAIRERSVELLDQLQIPNAEAVVDRYPLELSGGMRQRVLIAMAMLNDPAFLVADEPTTALDVTVQKQIIELLRDRIETDDLSMLYITHNLGVARQLADRIYVMYAGSIVEVGETERLFDAPLHPYTRGLIKSIPKLTDFESDGIPGSIPEYTDPPTGCRFHPRCPAAIEGECDRVDPGPREVERSRVYCHLYDTGMTAERAEETATAEIRYRDEDARLASSTGPGGSGSEGRSTDE